VLTKKEKIREIIKKVESTGISAYELAKNTNLNESGLNRILKGEIKNPHNSTIDLLYSYLYDKNTVSTNKDNTEERIKGLENKVSNLQQNFKMLYDQLLFLQNGFLEERKKSNSDNKSG
jgi:transcriptional regulator with XRE-family HTH domain